MTKILKHFFITLFLISVLTLPYFVFANPMGHLQNAAIKGGYSEDVSETTFSTIIGSVIQIFLGFLGIIFVILILWAGYNWMTAGGNEEKVTKAKNTQTRAIIGLIVTASAYAIWRYIYFKLIF